MTQQKSQHAELGRRTARLFLRPGKKTTISAAVVVALGGLGLAASRSPAEVPVQPTPVAALTVTSAAAQHAKWPAAVLATGTIAAWEEASIGSQLAGLRLIEVHAKVGDKVKHGQVLARFDSNVLKADEAQLKAAVAQAEALAAQAVANRQRALQLKGSGGISEQEVLQHVTQADTAAAQLAAVRAQLASKQLQLRYAEVVAPDDGIISARSATLGAVPANGQELFRLIRQNRLEWHGELGPSELAQMAAGQRIALDLPDGSTASARVRQVAPALDAQTRLGLVYADIEPGSGARAGMYARGRILLGEHGALFVPAASVVIRDGHSYVLKLGTAGDLSKVALQPVTTGRRQGSEIEIMQGLQTGDRVVVQGAAFLNDGDYVRLAPEVQSTKS